MNAETLSSMSDAELVARLAVLVREKRRLTVAVLLHLAEVEARGLHRRAACPSMYVYCTRVLGISEDQAFKRIRAARALRRYPVAAAALADGRLHLTAVVLLAPHLTDESADELVAEASGKSKAEIEILLARRALRAEVPARLVRVAEQPVLVPHRGPAGGQVVLEPPPNVAKKLAPRSPERFALQLTIGEATRSKLLRVQALLLDEVPSGDLAEVLDRGLDALLDKLEGRRFGNVKTPRVAKTVRPKRYDSNEARRPAVAKGGRRRSFLSEDGGQFEETGFLELDPVALVALGGEASDGSRAFVQVPPSARSKAHPRARGGPRRQGGQGNGRRSHRQPAARGSDREGRAPGGGGSPRPRRRPGADAGGAGRARDHGCDRGDGGRWEEPDRVPARTARRRPSRSPP
jgi:hypothetical protein